MDRENDALLRMLWSSLVQLREKCPSYIVELRFTWKLLNLMGIAPSLDLCVECGGLLTEGGWLAPGGDVLPPLFAGQRRGGERRGARGA